MRFERWRFKRKHGQAMLDMLDACGAEVERDFLLGKEHDVG
jgi:hypothetical protein